jgi:PAS domain-containing protein
MKQNYPLQGSGVARFRLKMLVTLMLTVGGLTAGGIYYVEYSSEAADQARLKVQFQGELGRRLGSQEARRAAIAERCQLMARSPRVLAALDEGELSDLYLNAEVELRDVLENNWDKVDDGFPKLLQARGFLFLNASGAVMPKPVEGKEVSVEAWEAQLAMKEVPKKQEAGYVVVDGKDGAKEINEVIVTPVVDPARGETLGAVDLYFAPVDLRTQSSEAGLKVGILLNDHLYMSSSSENGEGFARGEVIAVLGNDRDAGAGSVVWVGGAPYLAFSNLINPSSSFPAARQVCFYSIASSLAHRRNEQWEMAGAGAILLLVGLAVCYWVSVRLSKPVEQLAEDSAENLVQRARAEAALEVTEQKYQSIFENAIEGIFVLSEVGRFTSVNPAFAAICGYPSPRPCSPHWATMLRHSTEAPNDARRSLARSARWAPFPTMNWR